MESEFSVLNAWLNNPATINTGRIQVSSAPQKYYQQNQLEQVKFFSQHLAFDLFIQAAKRKTVNAICKMEKKYSEVRCFSLLMDIPLKGKKIHSYC